MGTTNAETTGNWTDATKWSNSVPGPGDDAIIDSGVVMTGNASMSCRTLQITGSIDCNGNTLTVVSGTTIKPGGLLSGSTAAMSLGSTMNGGTGSGGGPWIAYGLKVQEGTFWGGSGDHIIGALNVTNNANSKCYLTSGTTLLNGNGTSNSSNGQIVYVGTLSVLSSPVDSIVEINPGAGANPWTETQIEIRNDPLSNLYINCPTGTVNNYIGDGSAILNIGQEFHIVSGTFECNKGANANQGKLRVTGNTFISSSATVDLNDSDLCHFYANLDNDGTLTATSDVMTVAGEMSGTGSFVHNDGTVFTQGSLDYNSTSYGSFYNLVCYSDEAFNWKNEASPYQYIYPTSCDNDFTISGTYVRAGYSVTVGGDMTCGFDTGGSLTAAASGSGYVFDNTTGTPVLEVSGALMIHSGAYCGYSGFNYGGERGSEGVGYIGASNGRRGNILISGTVTNYGALGIGGDSTFWQGSSNMDGTETVTLGAITAGSINMITRGNVAGPMSSATNSDHAITDMTNYSGTCTMRGFSLGSDDQPTGSFYAPSLMTVYGRGDAGSWIWREDPASTFYPNNGTVNLAPTYGSLHSVGYDWTFYNLMVSGASTSHGIKPQSTVATVTNDFHIKGGIVDNYSSTSRWHITGNLILENGAIFELSPDSTGGADNKFYGNFINNGGTIQIGT